jgi:adenylate cyclase
LIFPLRLKLALLTSALLVAGIGTVSLLVLDQSRTALESEAQKRGISMAQDLARNARDPLLLEDDLVLSRLISTAAQEAEVRAVRVVDKDGAVVASSEEKTDQRVPRLARDGKHASQTGGGLLVAASRMTFQDVDLGEAQVVIDLEAVIHPIVVRARNEILIASGGLLLIGVLIAFAFSARVTRPLRRLRIATNALAAGDLNARVELQTRDEVGDLSRAFNEMGESLSQKHRVESAFRRYVSDHVLRQVIDRPDAINLVGETREVSIMFVDVRQFTRLSEGLGAEGVVGFLNDAFEIITNCILEHGGTVDKYMGDAIMAYFGAPIETEDHVERAVAAAIAAQRAVQERNAKLEASGRPFIRLAIGIAIHCGEVVVGNIGSERKMDYTAIGDAVNVASRLEKLAGERVILVTQCVADRVRDRVQLEPRGTRQLEGREQPVTIYRVLY